jgi:molybdopterin synthase catalytic subunit
MKISVQREDFDLSREVKAISGKTTVGAVASFVGLVEEARGRWNVMDCTVIHRHGELAAGDQIVLVAVASAHRGDAFAACEFIMDYLKTRATFWKKELRGEGASWVEARASDDEAAGRWTK